MKQKTTPPLVKLPDGVECTLVLIKEDLKSRKFFNSLHELGFDDCYYRPHLDRLILANIGLDCEQDETYNRYNEILERHSGQIDLGEKSATEHAVQVYVELMMELRKTEGLK